MPKMKTRKGIAKRFKVTKRRKVLRQKGGKGLPSAAKSREIKARLGTVRDADLILLVRLAAQQALAVMEAMKMEHTLHAPRDGVVAELLYAVGDQVAEGGELLRLEAAV